MSRTGFLAQPNSKKWLKFIRTIKRMVRLPTTYPIPAPTTIDKRLVIKIVRRAGLEKSDLEAESSAFI